MEEVSNEVDLLPADKHESLLQTDTMIMTGMVKQNGAHRCDHIYLHNVLR